MHDTELLLQPSFQKLSSGCVLGLWATIVSGQKKTTANPPHCSLLLCLLCCNAMDF